MKELVDYATFILENHLDNIAAIYFSRAKEIKLSLLHAIAHWSDEQIQDYLKNNYYELLTCIKKGKAYEYALESIAIWKDDKHPAIKRDQPGLHDLIQAITLRKYSFAQLLPTYTQDLKQGLTIVQELDEYYDFYREKAYEAFFDIQNEALQKEKDLVNTILDTTGEGIYALDRDQRVTIWNKTLIEWYGIEKDQILGKPIGDFLPEANKDILSETNSKAQSGELMQVKNIHIQSDEYFYEMDVVPLKDLDGTIFGSLTIAKDITERKLAFDELNTANEELRSQQEELYAINTALEEKIQELESTQKALQQSQHFIESIADTSPDYITVYNLKERKNVYANKGVAEFLGYKEHEVREGGFAFLQTIIHPEDIPKLTTFINEYLSYTGNKTRELEYRIQNYTGEYRWIRASYNVFSRDEQGVPLEVVGISKDVTERKLEEEERYRALNYYLTILDDFPALVWRSNRETKCDYFNKTWLHFTGRTFEQEYGDGWIEGVHPDDLQRCVDIYLSSFHARTPFEMEYRLKRHDGEYRYILDFGKPLYDLKGEFIGYLGVCFDIQERRNAEQKIHDTNHELAAALEELTAAEEQLRKTNEELERRVEERTRELAANEEELKKMLDNTLALNEALAEQENFLSSIIDQTPISTWIADAKGTQIRTNEACNKLFGIVDPDLGLGKYNILKDNVLIDTPFYKDILAVFTEGKVATFSLEYDLSKVKHVNVSDARSRYLIGTIFPIKNAKGEVTHAVVQHEDITKRRQAEQALKASEEQLRLITDALPVLISYVNANEEYTFVNKAYTTWFGKSKEEIIGKSVREILGVAAYENVKASIDKALLGEEVHFEGHMAYQFGEARDTMLNLIPHRINEKVVGFFTLVTDITSLKKAQAEIIKKNNELIRINTDLDNFIYTASHDLKSPIVNMEGLVAMMEQSLKRRLDEKNQKLMDMMKISIGKLNSTISYLIDVTKVAKNLDQQSEVILITEEVEDIKSDINHLIQEASPIFIEDYQVEQIKLAKASFRSIVYNLLSNAIKYRSPERSLVINISTFTEGDYVVFSVQDNGLGLLPKQQDKLFTIFKRLHTHVEGTGVGLYIVKRIIENIGGKVKVESSPEKGSKFHVYFPSGRTN